MFEVPELNQTVRVSEDGSITLSLIGKVDVAGLTAQDLEKKLAAILDQKWTKGAHVTVFIKEYQKVTVLGASESPATTNWPAPTSILQVISLAGGLTDQATNKSLSIGATRRAKKTRIVVDLESLMSGNEAVRYRAPAERRGHRPHRQAACTVYIYGEVKTPGAIQFKESKKLTLLQAIARAGGPNDWASKTRVLIKRKDKTTGQERNMRVNLRNMELDWLPGHRPGSRRHHHHPLRDQGCGDAHRDRSNRRFRKRADGPRSSITGTSSSDGNGPPPIVFFSVLAATVLYTFTIPPVYTARGSVWIDEDPNILPFQEVQTLGARNHPPKPCPAASEPGPGRRRDREAQVLRTAGISSESRRRRTAPSTRPTRSFGSASSKASEKASPSRPFREPASSTSSSAAAIRRSPRKR